VRLVWGSADSDYVFIAMLEMWRDCADPDPDVEAVELDMLRRNRSRRDERSAGQLISGARSQPIASAAKRKSSRSIVK
jgi:hypothetical protein